MGVAAEIEDDDFFPAIQPVFGDELEHPVGEAALRALLVEQKAALFHEGELKAHARE